MNLGELTPDPALFWFSLALYLLVLVIAVLTAPWRQLLARRERQNALGLAIVTLTVLYPEIVRTYDDVRYLGKPR
jgi:uncharacterized membrane protein